MSIYCSRAAVGWDRFPSERVGQAVTSPGNDLRRITSAWPKAWMDVAHIPAWCDHPQGSDEDYTRVAPWLRLMIGANDDRDPTAILIDETAARQLGKALLAWADEPKTRRLQ